MGASGWAYFTSYQSDIERALQELREQVFLSGRYYKGYEYLRDFVDEEEYLKYIPEGYRPVHRDKLRAIKAQREPSSIQELIDWNEEEGTHSILDIERITPLPEPMAAAPLSEDQLIMLFNTTKPTCGMIEDKEHELRRLRRSWDGTYVIVYKDGEPDEIYFTGFSGD